MRFLVIDFETRSNEPIANGAYKYAAHPSTEIICMGWAVLDIDDDPKRIYTNAELEGLPQIIDWGLWYNPIFAPYKSRLFPLSLITPETKIAAFNAEFDKGISDHSAVLNPVRGNVWYCVAAQVRAYGCPGSLDNAIRFIANNPQAAAKDKDGRMLIQECSIPPFNENPELITRIGSYCCRDVWLTCWLMLKTPRLSECLDQDWHVNRVINETGVPVDVGFASAAQAYAKEEISWVNAQLADLTDGAITSHTQTQRIRNAFFDPHTPLDKNIDRMTTVYRKGEKKRSLSKDIRRDILLCADDDPECISEFQHELVTLVDRATATSVSKYAKIQDMAVDGRVRGAFIFAGAGQTLRYSSRGLQLHNLRRDCYNVKDATRISSLIKNGRYVVDENENVMQLLAKMLRPTICPQPGRVLVVGDWSSIEARILPWLTKSHLAESILNRFFAGEDVYLYAAMAIYHKTDPALITAEERQIGKIATLSLGFGGGVGAFLGMAKVYGVVMDESAAHDIVVSWRLANPWARQFWKTLERVCLRACEYPDTEIGRIKARSEPNEIAHINGVDYYHMTLTLPCSTELHYHHTHSEGGDFLYAKAALSARQDAIEWPVHNLWYGIVAENATQATAASLLREKLFFLSDDVRHAPEFQIIGHCHDEIILECDSCAAENVKRYLQTEMETVPDWAEGLPLAAEVKVMSRYGK